MSARPPRLDIRSLSKSYGDIEVLRNVTFEVAVGQTFAVIGPNGAGKTTLFKVITGEAACTQGTIGFDGDDITTAPAHARARRGMGRTFQSARVFPNFSVLENIVVSIEAKESSGIRTHGRFRVTPLPEMLAEAAHYAEQVGLQDRLDTSSRHLAHGDKKRLELAMVLALRPTVLVMDEPTAGMSPGNRRQIIGLIEAMRKQHALTIVLTEHDMNVVFDLADTIMVMNYGEIVTVGDGAHVRSNAAVRQVYLGKGAKDA